MNSVYKATEEACWPPLFFNSMRADTQVRPYESPVSNFSLSHGLRFPSSAKMAFSS